MFISKFFNSRKNTWLATIKGYQVLTAMIGFVTWPPFLLYPTLIIKNNSYQVNKLVYKQAGSCICTYLYALYVPWCIGLGSSAYTSIVFNTDVLFLLIAIAAVDLISPSSVNY